MSAPEPKSIRLHDDPDFFRIAVNFTAKETAFVPCISKTEAFAEKFGSWLESKK